MGHIGEYQVLQGQTTTKQYELCSRYYDQSRDLALRAHPWNEAKKRVIIAQDDDAPIFGYDRSFTEPTDSLRVLSVNDSIGADRRNRASGVKDWEAENGKILANAGVIPQIWATTTKYVAGFFVSTTAETWATGTAYVDGQFVKDGSKVYEVLADHTSDTIVNDLASSDLDTGVLGSTGTYSIPTSYISGATVLADITSSNLVSVGSEARIIFIEYISQLTDTTKFSSNLKEAIGEQLAIKVVTGLTNDTRGKVDLINKFENLTMPKARSVDGAEGKPKPIFNSEWIRSRTQGARGYWG